MPHKRNPTSAQQALTAASRVPPLTQTLLAGMIEEHERGLSGWQAELPVLAQMFVLTFEAMLQTDRLIRDLEVDESAMLRNLGAAGVGDDVGESHELVERGLSDYQRRRA